MRTLIAILAIAVAMPAFAQDRPRPVASILVDAKEAILRSYTGSVVAGTEVELGFPMIGTISNRPVDVGDQVSNGDMLAQLSAEDLTSDLRSAEASVVVARSQLRSATNARDRAKELAERGVSSSTTLEDRERALVAAQAQLDQALSGSAQAQDLLDLATLKAPFDGVVTETEAEIGATVSAGQTVLRFADSGTREVVIDVSEQDAGLVNKGDRFTVRLLADDSVSAEAVLDRINPVAERATRTQRLHLVLENPSPSFRLGALARVEPSRNAALQIIVPLSAVLEPPAVWLVERGSNTVAKQPVVIAETNEDFAVIASGLTPGDEVVTKGTHSLEDGQIVGPRISE
ncbi:RND family efflux transporter, MFP subunit [Hoeflea phototrophica DFL-43]|uniref:RND family efflux transporter, MFP subunit n=1 Tax=Hoeflea phototrophica (strain DSM 17068 / NCIMB 14078 / DFL-43) TaxID=411684 RepID=A9D792_HOEPD|nr:RND family efflux transporter, MFP subunit [Hoeflea phototrophica DFL-43]